MEFLTKSVVIPEGAIEEKEFFKRNGKYVEIVVVFTESQEADGTIQKGLWSTIISRRDFIGSCI